MEYGASEASLTPTVAPGKTYILVMHHFSRLSNGWARPSVVLALLLLGRAVGGQSPRSAMPDTVRLTLDQAVQLGVRQSDEVGLAAAQTDVADAQLANARANVLPQLRFNGAYTHVYESARGQAASLW